MVKAAHETIKARQSRRSRKRRNDLIGIIFVSMIMIVFLTVGKFPPKNTIRDYSNKEEKSSVELEIKKKMALKETPTETPTETSTQAPTKIPTEAPTEVKKQAPTEVPTKVSTKTPTETPAKSYSEEDLYWLSHVIMAEVGNSTYESKAMCGLVVMNRVNSPSFAGETVEEVIFSPNQYETTWNGKIYEEPDEECIEIARKILSGTIEIQIPEDVVYQAEFPQGSGIYCQIGYEYYCFDD